MRNNGFVAAMTGIAPCLASGPVAAVTDTVGSLVQITVPLGHPPSDADNAVLDASLEIDASSAEEAAIATALANMNHEITAVAAEGLEAIVDDDLSADAVRELACILLPINHGPGDEDKVTLAALAE